MKNLWKLVRITYSDDGKIIKIVYVKVIDGEDGMWEM